MDNTLEGQWLELKAMETQIKERRYMLEQQIAEQYGYEPITGKSKKIKSDLFEVNFTASRVQKVDYIKLKQIQKENNIPQEIIESIFRFKAELNASEFKALPKVNQDILNNAITLQINKPTLKITPIEKD